MPNTFVILKADYVHNKGEWFTNWHLEIFVCSLQRRSNPKELDSEALAFRPALGAMLAAIYHNPNDMAAAQNQDSLQKILQFWGDKEVYNMDIINTLEGEMVAGPPPPEVPFNKPPPAGTLFVHVSLSSLPLNIIVNEQNKPWKEPWWVWAFSVRIMNLLEMF